MAVFPIFISLAAIVQVSRSSKDTTPVNRPRDPSEWVRERKGAIEISLVDSLLYNIVGDGIMDERI